MFAGEPDDFEGVFEGTGEGLVDEDGFFRGEGLAELIEVGATVDAFKEDGIDVFSEFLNGGVDFDPVFFDELLGVAGEQLGPALAHHDEVLDPNAAEAVEVDARLAADHVRGNQHVL